MYQVIARKYRPQSFEDVVNQQHVKQTLINALTQGRVGHGYIFSGPRGTGKTTMARILAKALNCEKGPGPMPCQHCSSCREITGGNSMDLVEIDAASNRRIDDIRELRENVRYRPVRDRHKVFIIDEAHQITADAFNALLKTLEEPPEWVVFILCTTEPQQFPATIVSRCQSFPFRTVEMEDVVGRMQWICEKEGIAADPDALMAIALAGDGSIRDSLSTLDQAIASFGQKLEAGPVRDLLGAIPSEITEKILAALGDQDASAMLGVVDRLAREGRHLQHFCGELTRYFRNLMVMKVSGADTRLVASGPEERKRLAAWAEQFNQEDLTRYVNLLVDLYRDMQNAPQPRFRLEIGLLKLVYAGRLQPLEKVLAQWNPGTGSGREAGSAQPKHGGGASAAPAGARAGNGAALEPGSEPEELPPPATARLAAAAAAGAAASRATSAPATEMRTAEMRPAVPIVESRAAAAAAEGPASLPTDASDNRDTAREFGSRAQSRMEAEGRSETAPGAASPGTAAPPSTAASPDTLPPPDTAAPPDTAPPNTKQPVGSPQRLGTRQPVGSDSQAGSEDPAGGEAGTASGVRLRLAGVLRGQGDDSLADALDHGRLEVKGSQLEIRSLPDYRVVLEIGLATVQEAVRGVLAGNTRVTLGGNLGVGEAGSPAGPHAAGLPQTPRPGNADAASGASETVQRALADPEVQRIQKLFAGQIREVRNLRGYTS
jgi:DNA polymerase-3 subunit gamma/tau